MKVAINGYYLGGNIGGLETYVRNVVRGLATVDPHGDYTLLLDKSLPLDAVPGAEHMRRVIVRPYGHPIRVPFWHHGFTTVPWHPPTPAASLALLREHIDVVHVQMAAPLLFPARIVVSLHDIVFERYPQFYPPDFVTRLRVTVPLTVRRAAAVLTVSEFSKRDIARRYGVSPDKITVAPDAADPMFQLIQDVERLAMVRGRYGTGERFILYVGNLEPHKNLKTLIAAYIRLRQADATRHKLVLVGRAFAHDNDILATAQASGYADDLVLTGYVPNEDLVALYNAADLFVFPSIFEGFGIPPLEAMACGTPVVTSNTSSLPEVVGDAALTVDPLDVEALAGAIARGVDDVDLRAELTARGLRRVRLFSWENTARTIKSVYQDVYDNRK